MKYKVQLVVHGKVDSGSQADARERARELRRKLQKAIRDAGLMPALFWVGLDSVIEVNTDQITKEKV